MTQISPILTSVWKVPAVFVLIILGVFASSQVGWSGLDVILNFQIMGLIEQLVSWPILVASFIFLLEPDSKVYHAWQYLAVLRVIIRMEAMSAQVVEDAIEVSQSLASRRHRPSHAKVRSTKHDK